MTKHLLNLIMLLASLTSFAAEENPAKILDVVLAPYKKSAGLVIDIDKLVKSELLEKETKHQTSFSFQKGKFNWKTELPEKSLIVYDGKTLWTVQYPPAEFKTPPQVAKTAMANNGSKTNVLSAILGQSKVSEVFEVVSGSKKGDDVEIKLKEKEPQLGVKNLGLVFSKKSKKITSIAYEDDIGNKTKLIFKNVKFKSKLGASLFKFTPPKDSIVTEY